MGVDQEIVCYSMCYQLARIQLMRSICRAVCMRNFDVVSLVWALVHDSYAYASRKRRRVSLELVVGGSRKMSKELIRM